MNLGLDPEQLLTIVIKPTLIYLGWDSPVAEQLVLGTAITESRLRYIKQLGGGPALGIYQMEPATFRDIKNNYLVYHQDHYELIESLRDQRDTTQEEELCYNLVYATAFCRAHYRRQITMLPQEGNAHALASYWKVHYNTRLGAGKVAEAMDHFQEAIDIFDNI